jgi:hypothetical protein
MALVFLIINAISASQPNSNGPTVIDMTNQWQRQQQQPYYQPPTQRYQPPQPSVPVYRPYDQGYAPVQETKDPLAQQTRSENAEYADYEQPQAQYPEQMPPMQQN